MILPEKHPITISEDKLADRFLLANESVEIVQVQPTVIGHDSMRYTVTGHLPLERQAITGIMGAPLGREDASWTEVRDGLREISYPHRKVRTLAHGALQKAHLRQVGPASRELAQALTDNQDQRTQTATMPIFNFFQSYVYTSDEIRLRTSTTKLMTYLKGIGMDFSKAQDFRSLTSGDAEDVKASKEIQKLLGLSDEDVQAIENGVLLSEAGGAIETELLYRVKNLLFEGFRLTPSYTAEGIKGGSHDAQVYIRKSDVPENLRDSLNATKVGIGPVLRDSDKKTGMDRVRVEFSTQAPRVVVHPQLVWENHSGARRLVFPASMYRSQDDWHHPDRPERPNSILGAALVADYLAGVKGIDYQAELEKRQRRAHRYKGRRAQADILSEAGLLPIVLDHQQEKLLDDDYFRTIEELSK